MFKIELALNLGVRKVFFLADTHFDHKNIILYCHRPFHDVREMNAIMLQNWRQTVGMNDFVLFLGDMSYGRGARPVSFWLSKLPGRIIYIMGNHELGFPIGENVLVLADAAILKIDSIQFYIIHNPALIPRDWDGWAIHGHKHDTSPFIDYENKRFCVSAEVINFTPMNLSCILESVLSSPSHSP